MPVINIREQEEVSFTAFDATENVVLIPILYARDYDWIPANPDNPDVPGFAKYKELQVPSKKYTSYQEFVSDFKAYDEETKDFKFYRFIQHTENTEDLRTGKEIWGEIDRSYIMAYQLLLQGLSVVIKPLLFDNASFDKEEEDSEGIKKKVKGTNTVVPLDEAYKIVNSCILNTYTSNNENDNTDYTKVNGIEEFKDRNIFNIKFITSGGYANTGNYTEGIDLNSFDALNTVASLRGDAIALAEFRPLFIDQEDVLNELRNFYGNENYYAAAFFPWCDCRVTAINETKTYDMPASYCYLSAYANSVRSNANWFAAAGVSRGSVPGLVKPLFEVGEALMHILQGDPENNSTYRLNACINPIYNAGTYGYRIWGNRVIAERLKDLFMNFLNVRVLLCDIKKQIYHAAMRVTFEPNDDIVWVNFKTLTSTPLERMKSGRGISWYKWTREYTNQKGTINAVLTIRPIEAVETFNINVVLTDEEAVIEEASDYIV